MQIDDTSAVLPLLDRRKRRDGVRWLNRAGAAAMHERRGGVGPDQDDLIKTTSELQPRVVSAQCYQVTHVY